MERGVLTLSLLLGAKKTAVGVYGVESAMALVKASSSKTPHL